MLRSSRIESKIMFSEDSSVVKSAMENLAAENKTLIANQTKADAQIAELQGQIKLGNMELSQISSKLMKANADVSEMKVRNASLETVNTGLKETKERLSNALEELKEKHEKLREITHSESKQLQNALAMDSVKDEKLTEYKRRVDALTAEVEQKTADFQQSNASLAMISDELNNQTVETARLQERCTVRDSELSEIKTRRQELDVRIKVLTTSEAEAKKKLETLERTHRNEQEIFCKAYSLALEMFEEAGLDPSMLVEELNTLPSVIASNSFSNFLHDRIQDLAETNKSSGRLGLSSVMRNEMMHERPDFDSESEPSARRQDDLSNASTDAAHAVSNTRQVEYAENTAQIASSQNMGAAEEQISPDRQRQSPSVAQQLPRRMRQSTPVAQQLQSPRRKRSSARKVLYSKLQDDYNALMAKFQAATEKLAETEGELQSSQSSLQKLSQNHIQLQSSSEALESSHHEIIKKHKKELLRADEHERMLNITQAKYDSLVAEIKDFSKGFKAVESCVHQIRGDGEIFLANLESQRRHHEDEVVSTEYQPLQGAVASATAPKYLGTPNGLHGDRQSSKSATLDDGRTISRVERALSKTDLGASSLVASSDTLVIDTESFPQLDASKKIVEKKSMRPLIPTEQRIALRAVFHRIDKHHTGKVNARDLTLALRRDPVVATYIHLRFKIRDEDEGFTTLQHIFSAIDNKYQIGPIMEEEFEGYFFVQERTATPVTKPPESKEDIYRQDQESSVTSNGSTFRHRFSPRVGSPLAFSQRRPFQDTASSVGNSNIGSPDYREGNGRVAASLRRGSHSSLTDLSVWPVNLTGSHALKSALTHTPPFPSHSRSPSSTGEDTKLSDRAPTMVGGGEQLSRMIKLCEFLSASITHERHVVHQYIGRVLHRELHHADTIDALHLGEDGLAHLDSKLEASQHECAGLQKQLSASQAKFEQSTKKYKELEHQSKLLDSKLQSKREQIEVMAQEKLSVEDREAHLIYDVKRLEHALEALRLEHEQLTGTLATAKEREKLLDEEVKSSQKKIETLEQHQVANLAEIATLQENLHRAHVDRDSHKSVASEHQEAHAETKGRLTTEQTRHAQTRRELENSLAEVTKERDHILSELTSRSHQLDDLKIAVREKEKLLQKADASLAAEVNKHERAVLALANVTKHEESLRDQLHQSQLKCLEVSRVHIEATNELEEWKTRYKESKDENERARTRHAEAHRKTQNQLARLGSQMVEDAKFMKMVEDDVHSGKEAAHTVEADLQEQERKLREIQFLLTAGQHGSMPLRSSQDPYNLNLIVDQILSALRSGTRTLYGSRVTSLLSLFQAIDVNSDGNVSDSEFRKALRRLDVQITEEQLVHMLEEMRKVDGKVSLRGFVKSMRKHHRALQEIVVEL